MLYSFHRISLKFNLSCAILACVALLGSSYAHANPPGKPILVAPAGSSSTNKPTYEWEEVPGATWYHLWVNDSTGTPIKQWIKSEVCISGGSCSASPNIAITESATWWVRAWNTSGSGPWSNSLRFTYGLSAPGKPTLVKPSNEPTTSTPTYSWNAVQNATWYQLWVNDDTGTPLAQWYTAASVDCASMVGVCSIAPTISISGNATWWVRGWNPAGNGAWSDPTSFYTSTLKAPLTCGFTNTGGNVEVNWTAAPSDGANRYVVERNRNTLGWYWVGAVNTENPLQLLDNVAANDRVQYRVKSRNAANDNSAFTTCIDKPIGNWQTTAAWEFEEPVGSPDIVDAKGLANGHIGFLPTAVDDNDVWRQNGVLSFNGADNSILVAPVTNSSEGNPNGRIFRWIVEFSVPQTSIDLLLEQVQPSWNLMQRGFYNNSGGQWKTQLITSNNVVKVECVVRDGSQLNGQGPFLTISAKSSNAVAIIADTVHTAICEFDDVTNELAIILNGERHTPSTINANVFPGATFGDVNPVGVIGCGGLNALGGSITIGNKPACNTIDDNDRFVGDIYRGELQK